MRIDSWTCHICKKERPDAYISVITKPLIIGGQTMGQQNIRYCNDNPDCINKARDFNFIKDSQW